MYSNKYAIEGTFVLCQQFFKGKKSSTVSTLNNSSASFSVKLVIKRFLLLHYIFEQTISKQNYSIIANWYYFFIDKMIVNWSSMDTTKEDNFDTLVYETFNQTYDWKSISHYTNKAFRKKNTLGYTLVSKVSYFCWSNSKDCWNCHYFIVMQYLLQRPELFKTTEIGSGNWLSVQDVQRLKFKYGCPSEHHAIILF